MDQNPLIEIGLPIALFVIMTGIGLTLAVADFRREARAPRGAVVGSLAQLLAMPVLAFGIAALLGLPPAIAVGLVIVGACPGGTTSNLVTYLARGNVALSIVMTVVASVVTIATLPIAANLALAWQPTALDVAISVPVGRTIILLIGIILVPVAIGMAVRQAYPEFARRAERGVSIFGGGVLALLIVGIAISVRDEFFQLLAQAGPAAILLNVSGLLVGWGVARLAGLDAADRLAIAVELGVKNTTLGILIAATVVGSAQMAVPGAVYGLLMYFSAFAVVAYGRRVVAFRTTATPGPPASPPAGPAGRNP